MINLAKITMHFFLFFALLKEKSYTMTELVNKCKSLGVSTDTVIAYMKDFENDNIVTITKKNDADGFFYVYTLSRDIFCFRSVLMLTDPLVCFPCQYFDCEKSEKCKMIDEVSLMLGIKLKKVRRIEETQNLYKKRKRPKKAKTLNDDENETRR